MFELDMSLGERAESLVCLAISSSCDSTDKLCRLYLAVLKYSYQSQSEPRTLLTRCFPDHKRGKYPWLTSSTLCPRDSVVPGKHFMPKRAIRGTGAENSSASSSFQHPSNAIPIQMIAHYVLCQSQIVIKLSLAVCRDNMDV